LQNARAKAQHTIGDLVAGRPLEAGADRVRRVLADAARVLAPRDQTLVGARAP
jgi:hypothetical protein